MSLARSQKSQRGYLSRVATQVWAVCWVTIACQSGPPPLHISLQFADNCPSANCDDYSMQCGSVLLVRIVSVPEEADGDVQELYRTCLPIQAADDVCAAGEAAIAPDSIPEGPVQIQVALWSPAQLAENAGQCPSGELFDLQGKPLDIHPKPTVAGARFAAAGESQDVVVPLTCQRPELLAGPTCTSGRTPVLAALSDLSTVLPLDSVVASALTVFTASPEPVGASGEFRLGATDALELTARVPPEWENGDAEVEFVDVGCVAWQTAQGPALHHCSSSLAIQPSNFVEFSGWHLPTTVVNKLLSAADLAEVPPQGLVMGRVVDHLGVPLAGVTLDTGAGSIVHYISPDLSSVTFTQTTSSGYFIVLDASFGHDVTAVHLDGRIQLGTPVTYPLQERIAVLAISMAQPMSGDFLKVDARAK